MFKNGVLLTGIVALTGCSTNPVLITTEQECEVTHVRNSHGHQEFKRCASSTVVDRSKSAKELDLTLNQRGSE